MRPPTPPATPHAQARTTAAACLSAASASRCRLHRRGARLAAVLPAGAGGRRSGGGAARRAAHHRWRHSRGAQPALAIDASRTGAAAGGAPCAAAGPRAALCPQTAMCLLFQVAGTRVRLFAIDAPETKQLCERQGAPYSCGAPACRALASRPASQPATCTAARAGFGSAHGAPPMAVSRRPAPCRPRGQGGAPA